MYDAKTKPTKASVKAYLAAIDDPQRRADCQALADLMSRVSGCEPHMWGTSIVGFDSYHYKYDSGHEGDACVVGFSSRKDSISLYLMPGFDTPTTQALLAQLGKHKAAKACLYIKRLTDVQLPVLEKLIAHSIAELKRHTAARAGKS